MDLSERLCLSARFCLKITKQPFASQSIDMLSQLSAFALIITSLAFSLPNGPSINSIDSWVPVNYASSGDQPLPPISSSWKESTAELFVGISHYRDSRCSATLSNLFSKAKYPDRLTVGNFFFFFNYSSEYDLITGIKSQVLPNRFTLRRIIFIV